jgi:hypothetical protein
VPAVNDPSGGDVGGAHGLEDGFKVVGVLVLELVDDEEPVGGFAAGGGLGMGTHEDDVGPTEGAGYEIGGLFPSAEVEGVVEALLEAADTPSGGGESVASRVVDPAGWIFVMGGKFGRLGRR